MKDNQTIDCTVHDCKYCDCDENICKLKCIKICNCNDRDGSKENTMCYSYKKK